MTGLSEGLNERKLSKTSLFTRLRKKQLGPTKGKVSPGSGTPDHRLSLALSDTQDTLQSGNVSRQGSHSCPSSPSLNTRHGTPILPVLSQQNSLFLGDALGAGKMYSKQKLQDKHDHLFIYYIK